MQGLPWWLRQQRICLQCRRLRFDSWVRKSPWRRKWQPIPVFLPEKSHGQRSLARHKKLDTTERLGCTRATVCSYVCTYAHIHMQTHAYIGIHEHTYAYRQAHARMRIRLHLYVYTYARAHTHSSGQCSQEAFSSRLPKGTPPAREVMPRDVRLAPQPGLGPTAPPGSLEDQRFFMTSASGLYRPLLLHL